MNPKFSAAKKADMHLARKVSELYQPEEIDFGVLVNFDIPRIRTVYRYIQHHFGNTDRNRKIKTLEIGYHIGLVVESLRVLDGNNRFDFSATERYTPENWEIIGQPRCPVDALDLMDTVGRNQYVEKNRESYDCILLGEVIEHIPSNFLSAIFNAMYALLVEGGLLIVTTPNLHNLYFRISHLLGADYDRDAVPNHMGFPHIHNCSLRKVVDFAHASGLFLTASEYTNFGSGYILAKSNSSFRRFLERLRVLTLCRLFPSLGDDFIASFTKDKSKSGKTSLIFGQNHMPFIDAFRSRR